MVAVVAGPGAAATLPRFFRALPKADGAAFVVIDASGPAPARAFGGRSVVAVRRRVKLLPGRVCVAAPGAYLSIAEDLLYPLRQPPPGELPADHLLRALADERAEMAVAVLLGNPGRDGPAGAQAIDQAGGLVAANTAKIDVARMEAPAARLARMVAEHVAGLLPPDVEALAARIARQRPAVAGVLVNRQGEILHVLGRTGHYLEPAAGYAQWNVVAMARPGLREAIAAALPEAFDRRTPVRRRGLVVETASGVRQVDLAIEPADERRARGVALVSFRGAA